MRNKRTVWGVLAVIGIIVVVFLAREFGPRPKARVQAGRIANVNRVSSVSMVITNTNTPPSSNR